MAHPTTADKRRVSLAPALPALGLLMLCLIIQTALAPGLALAQGPAQENKPDGNSSQVRGNPEATVGGVRRTHFSVSPPLLHPLNATDYYGNKVLDLIYETLVGVDVDTMEHIPLLASRWETAPDKLSYTFWIDPRARWHDGRPVTARDVAHSFDVLFHPKLKTRAKWQAYYSNLSRVEVLDGNRVRFHVKRDHFLNFVNLASMRIVPAHMFKGDDPDKTSLASKPLGSGPYLFSHWKKGQSILLKRNPEYWGRELPQNAGRYNIQLLLTKIIPTEKVALEAFKKGDLDAIEFRPEQWARETNGPEFGLGASSGKKLVKLDIQNKAPRGYRYVGWNLESPLFSDRRARQAMGHLFDRRTFIEKFYHGLQVEAVGPFETNSRYSSPDVKPLEFSPKKALELLHQAGWKDSDGDSVLDKNGVPFRFTIMTADRETSVKMLTLAKETMRSAGVDMSLKVVDWSTLLTLIDEYRFDAVMLGWKRSPWPDPTALWHSESAQKGGLNLVRYRNPEVDGLIEKATRTIPDTERVKLFRRIHELIFNDQPYTFMTEENHILVGYQNTFRMVKPWYEYDVGYDYWWTDAKMP